jgi:hypothetical protein
MRRKRLVVVRERFDPPHELTQLRSHDRCRVVLRLALLDAIEEAEERVDRDLRDRELAHERVALEVRLEARELLREPLLRSGDDLGRGRLAGEERGVEERLVRHRKVSVDLGSD